MKRAYIATFLFCVSLQARTAEVTEPSHDPWLRSPNAAALTRYAFANVGMAELSLTRGNGGFTDFSDSPDALSVDASVASFFRLNSRAVVYGSMSYTNFSGRDMAGSVFISRHLPFDIVEDSLTNTGTKHKDTYRLTGGVGYDIWHGFSLGARLAFTAANMAKYKDLRHKNKLMDLDLTAGFYLPVNLRAGTGPERAGTRPGRAGTGPAPTLAIGANYLYHRTTESLRFSTYGKNDKVYNSLISYANFIGHIEQFGSEGYTDKSRDMPLVSDYNGVGIQMGFSPALLLFSYRFSLYNSFTYARRRGYYGRRSPFTITYADHESDTYRYDASLSAVSGRGSRFSLDLSLSSENLRNDAANYREMQNEQDATYYEYYTPVKTANKLWTDGTVALTADLGRLHPDTAATTPAIPRWSLQMGLNWHRREQTAYVYPFYRRQDIRNKEFFVSLSHSLGAGCACGPRGSRPYWTFAVSFSYLKGSGEPFEDLTFQAPSDKQELPPVMDAYLWREYMWLTAAQYQAGGSVAYSFIFPGTSLRTFARLSVSHRKANETSEYSLGNDHTTASLAIGCNF